MRYTFEVYKQIAVLTVEEAVTYPDLLSLATEFKKLTGNSCTHVFADFSRANLEEASFQTLGRMQESLEKLTHKVVRFVIEPVSMENALNSSHVPESRQYLEKFKVHLKIHEIEKEIAKFRSVLGDGDLTLDRKLGLMKEAAHEERWVKFLKEEITYWKTRVAAMGAELEKKTAPSAKLIAEEKRILDSFQKKPAEAPPA